MADTATALATPPGTPADTAAPTAAVAAIPAQRRTVAIDVHAPDGLQTWVFPLARHVQAVVDAGVHPATKEPIHPDSAASCFSCIHAVKRPLADGAQRTRCELSVSRRKGPDLLPIFPACTSHTPRTEGPQS